MRKRGPVGLMLLALLATASALTVERCEVRIMDIEEGGNEIPLAAFLCYTDGDLYVNTPKNASLAPILFTSTAKEVKDHLAGTSDTDGKLNFAANTVRSPTEKIPNYLYIGGNFKLQCGDVVLEQEAKHDYPVDFLYTMAPYQNLIGQLWKASFGAFAFPDPPLPRAFGFALALGPSPDPRNSAPPTFSHSSLGKCIDDGDLKVVVDQTYDPEVLWKFVDVDGNALSNKTQTVTRRTLTCDYQEFKTFTKQRIGKLVELLDTATGPESTRGNEATYTTVVNDERFAGCFDLLTSFFETENKTLDMEGISACEYEYDTTEWNSDPCCNDALRLGDCCVPSTRTMTIDGLFRGANSAAIATTCGDKASAVEALVNTKAFANMLRAAQDPETGCDAAARSNSQDDSDAWERLMNPIVRTPTQPHHDQQQWHQHHDSSFAGYRCDLLLPSLCVPTLGV